MATNNSITEYAKYLIENKARIHARVKMCEEFRRAENDRILAEFPDISIKDRIVKLNKAHFGYVASLQWEEQV